MEFPLGEESGLPLIPCPDCGLARVIERRSMKEGKNHLRVYFKCLRNGYPKLCGFYGFQRQYLDKLKELGIVTIRNLPALACDDEAAAAADATSGHANLQVEVGEKEPKRLAKMEEKMEDIMWKSNLLMLALAVVGSVFMYIAMKLK